MQDSHTLDSKVNSLNSIGKLLSRSFQITYTPRATKLGYGAHHMERGATMLGRGNKMHKWTKFMVSVQNDLLVSGKGALIYWERPEMALRRGQKVGDHR